MQSTGTSCVYQSEIEEENKQHVPAPHSRRAVWTGLTVSHQTSVTMSVHVFVHFVSVKDALFWPIGCRCLYGQRLLSRRPRRKCQVNTNLVANSGNKLAGVTFSLAWDLAIFMPCAKQVSPNTILQDHCCCILGLALPKPMVIGLKK